MRKTQQLHREHDPKVRRLLATAWLCAVLIVLSALAAVALRVQQVRLAYRLDALQTERTRIESVVRQLEIEVATLGAPARLDARARQLGMTNPGRQQVRLAREYVEGGTGLAADWSLRADAGAQAVVRVRRAR